MTIDVIDWLAGPNGGIVALSVAVGAAGAWGFAMRVCNQRLGAVQQRIEDLSSEVKSLRDEVHRWQKKAENSSDELVAALRRQLRQQETDMAAKILGYPSAFEDDPED